MSEGIVQENQTGLRSREASTVLYSNPELQQLDVPSRFNAEDYSFIKENPKQAERSKEYLLEEQKTFFEVNARQRLYEKALEKDSSGDAKYPDLDKNLHAVEKNYHDKVVAETGVQNLKGSSLDGYARYKQRVEREVNNGQQYSELDDNQRKTVIEQKMRQFLYSQVSTERAAQNGAETNAEFFANLETLSQYYGLKSEIFSAALVQTKSDMSAKILQEYENQKYRHERDFGVQSGDTRTQSRLLTGHMNRFQLEEYLKDFETLAQVPGEAEFEYRVVPRNVADQKGFGLYVTTEYPQILPQSELTQSTPEEIQARLEEIKQRHDAYLQRLAVIKKDKYYLARDGGPSGPNEIAGIPEYHDQQELDEAKEQILQYWFQYYKKSSSSDALNKIPAELQRFFGDFPAEFEHLADEYMGKLDMLLDGVVKKGGDKTSALISTMTENNTNFLELEEELKTRFYGVTMDEFFDDLDERYPQFESNLKAKQLADARELSNDLIERYSIVPAGFVLSNSYGSDIYRRQLTDEQRQALKTSGIDELAFEQLIKQAVTSK